MSFRIPTPPPVLSQAAQEAAYAYIAKANRFICHIEGVGAEASQNLVVGIMKLLERWYNMRVLGVGWDCEIEVREWCRARYVDNRGAEWLAPFTVQGWPACP